MAKQVGPIYFTGTIGDLIFYKLGENYYMRMKGEPTTGTKKKLKDKNCYPVLNFRKQEFGEASELAKAIYYQLPKKLRGHGKQQKLTGRVVRMMRQGMKKEDIKVFLLQELLENQPTAEQPLPAKPAVMTAPKNEKPKSSPSQPNQQPAIITAKTPLLSNWKVCGNGRLYKEATKQQPNVLGSSIDQTTIIKSKYCHPYPFSGLVLKLRDVGDH